MTYAKTTLLLIAFFVFSPIAARAAGCDLSASANKLAEIQAVPALDYLENLRMELQARKELLNSAIDCVITETDELKAGVEGLPNRADAAGVKQEVISNIQNARGYLERQKGQIQNLGIQGTKNTARELKNWKDNAYAQVEDEANNLKIWNGNQTLFETAGKRLEEITKTVRLLKLLENDDIRSMYEKSEASLRNAGDLHRRALQDIKNYRPQEEIASSLKISLEALSQTYKNFLDLSQAVKKILPL